MSGSAFENSLANGDRSAGGGGGGFCRSAACEAGDSRGDQGDLGANLGTF
jgi:hypothetical protein